MCVCGVRTHHHSWAPALDALWTHRILSGVGALVLRVAVFWPRAMGLITWAVDVVEHGLHGWVACGFPCHGHV